jgi:hypothetical protein
MMQAGGNNSGARSSFLIWIAVIGFAALLLGELWLGQQLTNLRADRDQLASQLAAAEEKITAANEALAARQNGLDSAAQSSIGATDQGVRTAQRLLNLEQRVQAIIPAAVAASPQFAQAAHTIPEFNALNPTPPPEPEPAPDPPSPPDPDKRSWGEEQVIGPPNVTVARDDPNAWASREPDAGPEWLAVQFANIVEVAEIRIRESYNPGAISKVTANMNGQEYTIWEGTAEPGPAPRDFVIPVQSRLQTSAITIHLDSARVPGWNEIDAVELIGRDGSRQWAIGATASSTFASPRTAVANLRLR